MSDKKTLRSRSESFSRTVKLTVATFAIVYAITGTAAVAGYTNAFQPESKSPTQDIAELVWIGVSWPAVMHRMVATDPLQRVEPLPQARS